MLWKIFIIKPDSELIAAHKFFAIIIKFFIMSKIEVVDKPASSYCLTDLDLLFL